MPHKYLLSIISLLLALSFPSASATAQQSPRFALELICQDNGSANMIFANMSETTLRATAFTRTASSSSLGDSLTLDPGERQEILITPRSMPTHGWSLLVEDVTPGGDVVYETRLTEGRCTYGGEALAQPPTQAPLPTSEPAPSPTSQPTAPQPTEPAPVVNSFNFTAAQRSCGDQTFSASWAGTNVAGLEFSLTNTSDDWTTGWFDVDPSAGSLTQAVDHHSYDKVMANATFEDGTTESVSVNVGQCTEAAAPPPPSTGGSAAVTVSSLPSTGSGNTSNMVIALGALTLMTGTLLVAGALRQRR